MKTTRVSDFRQNAEARDMRARKKLARKARLVFRTAPALMDALEIEGVYTTERTAGRWLKVMSEKAFVQKAVIRAMRVEASSIIKEMQAIAKGEFL